MDIRETNSDYEMEKKISENRKRNDMTKILICSSIEKSNIGVPTVYLKNQNGFPIFLDTHLHFYLGVFRLN